jgi:hypothetical protein
MLSLLHLVGRGCQVQLGAPTWAHSCQSSFDFAARPLLIYNSFERTGRTLVVITTGLAPVSRR